MRASMFKAVLGGSILALSLVAACGDTIGPVELEEQTFAPALGIDLSQMQRLPSGVYIKDEIVGTGAAAATGSTLTVFYTGWIANGRQFDSNVGRTAFTVTSLGDGRIIAGWEEGLIGVRAGGRRLLVIPYFLGYGSQGSDNGVIPPYANLIFRIDVQSVVNR